MAMSMDSKLQMTWVGSAMTVGAGSVCILTGYLINFVGRKTTMLLLVIPFTLGWALIIFAQNVTMLIIGRTLLGVSSGGICVVAPMYTGEIAEKEIRGMLCSRCFCDHIPIERNLCLDTVDFRIAGHVLS